jgi:hypothetical protein
MKGWHSAHQTTYEPTVFTVRELYCPTNSDVRSGTNQKFCEAKTLVKEIGNFGENIK